MIRKLPLGPRLALAFAAPATLSVLVCGAVAFLGTRAVLEEELGKRLCTLAAVVAQTVPKDLALVLEEGDEDTRTAQNVRRKLEVALGGSVSRVMLVDSERRVFMDTRGELPIGSEASRLQLDQVEMERAERGTPSASVLFSGPDGTLYKSCYASVPGEGPSLLVAVEGAADLFRNLYQLGLMYAVLLLLALGLLVAVAYAVARQIAQPLLALSLEARAMGEGNLSRSISVAADDEVGQVARALEEMRLRLRARDEERQMMLAGIAHEVRNPLGGMELYAGILAETAADLPADTPVHLKEELLNAVGRIRRELGYLSGVVNDFLHFARDVPPQRKDVDARALLDEVAGLCQSEVVKKGVQLRVEGAEGLMATVDDGQLRGALLNLAQNAIQACPEGSTVELRAAREGELLRLTVADNGPGMGADALQKALTPFFTTKEKGTGLGLPLVVKTARAHGGRLDVKTAPGEGFAAHIVIPLQAAD